MAISANFTAILKSPTTDLVVEERPAGSPGPGEILVQNKAIALNPIEWKRQAWNFLIPSYPVVMGCDLSGTIVEIGPDVTNFKVGDRVVGFSHGFVSGNNDHSAYQNYTVVKSSAAGPLPPNITFQQGATLCTATATAAMALFDAIGFPLPTSEKTSSAILIWGGATSVGQMAIQLARIAGITVITTASKHHHDHLLSLGAAAVVEYKSPTAVDEVVAAAENLGMRIERVVDTVSEKPTLEAILQVLAMSGGSTAGKKVAHLLPAPEGFVVPESVEAGQVHGEEMWGRREDLAKWLFNSALPAWLESGEILPLKIRVVDGGLGGIQEGLNLLKAGGVSGEKLVVEV